MLRVQCVKMGRRMVAPKHLNHDAIEYTNRAHECFSLAIFQSVKRLSALRPEELYRTASQPGASVEVLMCCRYFVYFELTDDKIARLNHSIPSIDFIDPRTTAGGRFPKFSTVSWNCGVGGKPIETGDGELRCLGSELFKKPAYPNCTGSSSCFGWARKDGTLPGSRAHSKKGTVPHGSVAPAVPRAAADR